MSRCNSSWRWFFLVAAYLAVGTAVRAEELVARVRSDRVNLRARPDTSAEVIVQANAGDRFTVVSTQADWVAIVPPESVDFWAHRDFVKDGVSTVNKLNLRAGPGINYSIVGSVESGVKLDVRGQFGEWMKVAPSNGVLWISRELVDVVTSVRAASPPVPVAVEESEPAGPPLLPPAEAAPALGEVIAPISPQPMQPSQSPARAAPPPSDLTLVPLEGQGQRVQREGELKPAPFLFGRPSAFRLVKKEGVQMVTVCYVRGNTAQLNSLMNETLTIFGREYWVQGVKQPVVVLERIERRAP